MPQGPVEPQQWQPAWLARGLPPLSRWSISSRCCPHWQPQKLLLLGLRPLLQPEGRCLLQSRMPGPAGNQDSSQGQSGTLNQAPV